MQNLQEKINKGYEELILKYYFAFNNIQKNYPFNDLVVLFMYDVFILLILIIILLTNRKYNSMCQYEGHIHYSSHNKMYAYTIHISINITLELKHEPELHVHFRMLQAN